MTPRLDLISLVVADMGRSLAFYRRLGLPIPAGTDAEPHLEVALPGGLRLAWETRVGSRRPAAPAPTSPSPATTRPRSTPSTRS
jgi:catechol 2,3-dioxygenase-like lactoylglutathione lyase family enzyme